MRGFAHQRRLFLLAALAAAVHGAAPAQSTRPPQRNAPPAWPTRPVRILLAYPAGGVSDLIARELAELVSTQLSVPVFVENRPGASGTLAMDLVARSAADGYTLGFGAATAVALLASMGQRDPKVLPVTPVAGVMRTPVLVVGTSALPSSTFTGMLAQARAEPGGIRWATTGEGTTGHSVLERVRRASGTHIIHIPYKGGGQQLNDALGGHFEVLSTNVAPQQLEAIKTGRFTALAVGAPERLPVLPDVPTLAELGFARANLDSLFGLFAPPGTPAGIVARINAEVAVALRNTSLRSKLLAASNTPYMGSAAEFAAQVRLEAER